MAGVTLTYSFSLVSQGMSHSGVKSLVTEMGIEPVSIALPAATVSDGWTKTDANAAEAELPEGHDLVTGTFDVYDTSGNIIRYGVPGTLTPGTPDTLALDGGAGSDFPASDSTVRISQQQAIPENWAAAALQWISAKSSQAGYVTFQDGGGAVLVHWSLTADLPHSWVTGFGDSEFTSTVANVTVSNGGIVAAEFSLIGGQDAVT